MKRLLCAALCFCLLTEAGLTGAVSTEEQKASVSESAANVANATIDAVIYLDYAAGIEAGVYRWVLSEDCAYYTLAAVDESGESLTAQEAAINVGANNEERGGGFPGGEEDNGPKGAKGRDGGFGGQGKMGDFPGMQTQGWFSVLTRMNDVL